MCCQYFAMLGYWFIDWRQLINLIIQIDWLFKLHANHVEAHSNHQIKLNVVKNKFDIVI